MAIRDNAFIVIHTYFILTTKNTWKQDLSILSFEQMNTYYVIDLSTLKSAK